MSGEGGRGCPPRCNSGTAAARSRRFLSYTIRHVRIRASARKHGIHDEDIRHALRHALGWKRLDRVGVPAMTLIVGPDRAANLLETIVVHDDDGTDVVIHAMRLRPRYRMLLPHHDH